jgi:hypothetical protein
VVVEAGAQGAASDAVTRQDDCGVEGRGFRCESGRPILPGPLWGSVAAIRGTRPGGED